MVKFFLGLLIGCAIVVAILVFPHRTQDALGKGVNKGVAVVGSGISAAGSAAQRASDVPGAPLLTPSAPAAAPAQK